MCLPELLYGPYFCQVQDPASSYSIHRADTTTADTQKHVSDSESSGASGNA